MYQTSLLGLFTRLTKTRPITCGLSSSMSAVYALSCLLIAKMPSVFGTKQIFFGNVQDIEGRCYQVRPSVVYRPYQVCCNYE